MLKTIACKVAALVLLASAPVHAAGQPETLTLFHHADKAWGVGTIRLSSPLKFRDGKLLVFPAQFTDLLWAPNDTKPRNMMVVVEVWPDDTEDKPFLKDGDEVFAPIVHLPQSAYWKDNLPHTNRHQIPGGRRFVFRGEQIPEVRKVLEAYLKAGDAKGADRLKNRLVAVATGLESPVQFVREDAVTWFVEYPSLARDFDDRALVSIKAFLAGSAPAEEKSKLIAALSAAKIESVKPLLQEQAKVEDASGAAALHALAEQGANETTDALLEKSRAASQEVQAYALQQLGSRASSDDAAFARCKEILDPVTTPPTLSSACLSGLSQAKGDRTRSLLVFVIERGDVGSREAALALASWGEPEAATLEKILDAKTGEPAKSAAIGLSQMTGCKSCGETLDHAHHEHPDEQVRDMIGVIMGVPMVHKH
jgi:hypothetical protein